MKRICNNDDFCDTINRGGLTDAASNSKEFGSHKCNVHSVIDSFGDRIVTYVNVYNRSCYIVFDAGISNNKC